MYSIENLNQEIINEVKNRKRLPGKIQTAFSRKQNEASY